MRTDPMTADEQAVLFNRVLKNQVMIMSSIGHLMTKDCLLSGDVMPSDIRQAIEETKDTRRIVEYVENWST